MFFLVTISLRGCTSLFFNSLKHVRLLSIQIPDNLVKSRLRDLSVLNVCMAHNGKKEILRLLLKIEGWNYHAKITMPTNEK